MESKDSQSQWMILDSLCQGYGPFDSYEEAREELISRGWKLVSGLNVSVRVWDFLYYLLKIEKDRFIIFHAKIVPLKQIKSVNEIPS